MSEYLLPRSATATAEERANAKRLQDVATVLSLAYELRNRDLTETVAWINAPNPRFYRTSPLTMCLAGMGDRVYGLQRELLGATPVASFHPGQFYIEDADGHGEPVLIMADDAS